MTFLLENNFWATKTGKGFYHKTDQKDQNGKKTIINALDLKTLEYKPSYRPNNPILKKAKGIENMQKRMPFLVVRKAKKVFSQGLFLSYFCLRGPASTRNFGSILPCR